MNSTDWNHCVTGFTTFMTWLATLVFISMEAEKKITERRAYSAFKSFRGMEMVYLIPRSRKNGPTQEEFDPILNTRAQGNHALLRPGPLRS